MIYLLQLIKFTIVIYVVIHISYVTQFNERFSYIFYIIVDTVFRFPVIDTNGFLAINGFSIKKTDVFLMQ